MKHRQVLEVARALRFQSGLALSFWGDCVLAAVYIINRLPNAALNFVVPFEKLHKESVDYEHLKSFGCLAVAYDSQHGTDKFNARGIACCFVGYPPGTKGYRLLNLTTMQPFLSRHVRFFKNVFPLNKNYSKPYRKSLPIEIPLGNAVDYEDELVNDLEETKEVVDKEEITGNSDKEREINEERQLETSDNST